jgi:hypothetical protein
VLLAASASWVQRVFSIDLEAMALWRRVLTTDDGVLALARLETDDYLCAALLLLALALRTTDRVTCDRVALALVVRSVGILSGPAGWTSNISFSICTHAEQGSGTSVDFMIHDNSYS